MATDTRTLFLIALVSALTHAQSQPAKPSNDPATKPTSRPIWMEEPDDRYVKLLAGKKLEDGKGFPGVVAIGDHLGKAMEKLGNGREDMSWMFWYFYDKGSWQLTLCTDFLTRRGGGAHVHAVIIEGDGAPPTTKGVRIGDAVSKVVQAYGPSKPFNGALVGLDHKGRKMVEHTFAGNRTYVLDDPPEFENALFFPAARLLVAVKDERVLKLAIVAEEDPLPEFLQPQEKILPDPIASVKIDPAVDLPTRDSKVHFGFLLPPAPELVDYKGAGWSARVPKGWTLADDVWTDASGTESVTIWSMKANPEESTEGAMGAMVEIAGAVNLVPAWRRSIPDSFLKMVGASEGFCAVTSAENGGKEGLPLRTYRLLLTKGDRRYLIAVTRTQHPRRIEKEDGGFEATAFVGSPDGDALARGVMRSFRIVR